MIGPSLDRIIPLHFPPPPTIHWCPDLVNECVHLTNSQGGLGRLTITSEDAVGNFSGTYSITNSNAALQISGLQVTGTLGATISFDHFTSHIQFSGHATTLSQILGFSQYETEDYQTVSFSGTVLLAGTTASVTGSIAAEVVSDLVTSDPSHTLVHHLSDITAGGAVGGGFVPC